MKNNVWIFWGMLSLGICILFSTVIYCNSIDDPDILNHSIHGSISVNEISSMDQQNEYLPIGTVSALLGYAMLNHLQMMFYKVRSKICHISMLVES